MPLIKTIGSTLFQRADQYWNASPVGFARDRAQNNSADSAALVVWMHIEMIELQTFWRWPRSVKTYLGIFDEDEECMLRAKIASQSLASSHWIKTADALKTLAHGCDAKVGQRVEIGCDDL